MPQNRGTRSVSSFRRVKHQVATHSIFDALTVGSSWSSAILAKPVHRPSCSSFTIACSFCCRKASQLTNFLLELAFDVLESIEAQVGVRPDWTEVFFPFCCFGSPVTTPVKSVNVLVFCFGLEFAPRVEVVDMSVTRAHSTQQQDVLMCFTSEADSSSFLYTSGPPALLTSWPSLLQFCPHFSCDLDCIRVPEPVLEKIAMGSLATSMGTKGAGSPLRLVTITSSSLPKWVSSCSTETSSGSTGGGCVGA
mmetsp:Transcript_23121/g.65539  ORF Transcript_23121/g.65539 Transcript_23121/m.65539 type:complete len:250 (+) Transcript_23121:1209-1958(+)